MIFIWGINQGHKEFAYDRMAICKACGSYGRYMVYMTYTVLTLFFIPTFRWRRRYFVRSSCCGSVYQLAPEVGRQIARGEEPEIRPEDLTLVQRGTAAQGMGEDSIPYGKPFRRHCSACGYTTEEEFEYCPKCGRRFS